MTTYSCMPEHKSIALFGETFNISTTNGGNMGEAIQVSQNLRNQIEFRSQKDEGKSSLISQNVTILGKRTSIRLEPEMWAALKDISQRENCSMNEICSLVYSRKKTYMTLTSAVRVFLMLYYRAASTQEGHTLAGHGSFIKMRHRAKIV